MEKAKIAPFYPMQKIVHCYTGSSEWETEDGYPCDGPVVNQVYTCVRCFLDVNGWAIILKEFPSDSEGYDLYNKDGSINFKPVEMLDMPLMTFTEIKKKEKEEILILN